MAKIPRYKDMIEKRKSAPQARPDEPENPQPPGIPGRRRGQKSGLAAGRNPQLPGQRRKALGKHYRAKFIAGRSGRR
jgi:hypothetical protein